MIECPREAEMLDLLLHRKWDDPDLADHVGSCKSCNDLFVIMRAFDEDHAHACRTAPVPSAGLVWWRATIRARAEAAVAVERPLTIAQAIGGAAVAGLACGVVGFAWRAAASVADPGALLLGLGAGICAVLAPLAVAFAFARD